MKHSIIAAAAVVAMVGCNKITIEHSNAEGYGSLALELFSDVDIVETKALSNVDDPAAYNIKLYSVASDNSESLKWSKEFSAMADEDLTVSAGNYKFVAENVTESEAETGHGQVRVVGTSDVVAVAAGETESVIVNCNPVNAKVTIAYADGFTDTFTDASCVLKDGETRTLTMTAGHDDANAAYFNVDDGTLSWTVTAKVSGVQKTYTKTFSVEQRKWSQITFSAGQNGKLAVSINADTEMEVSSISETLDPLAGENAE